MFFAGEGNQVVELPDEHANILPQIGGFLLKYCLAINVSALSKFAPRGEHVHGDYE